MAEGIVWPGSPEKPRVLYLWSLREVSRSGGAGAALRFLAGPGEGSADDSPRDSDVLVRPSGVFVDDKDRMYIADTGALRVLVVDLNSMEALQIDNADDFPLFSPVGVVADRAGQIYVTDSSLGAVLVFDSEGRYLRKFEGAFKRPTGIAINPDAGLIYVADTWAHTVYICDLAGRRVGAIGTRGGGPGEFNYPTYVALDRDGYLYVSDTLNFRFQIFTPRGGFVGAFGLIGDSFLTFDKIKGIAVDSEGHIYVADSGQDMVKIYDREGRLLLFFGEKGHFYGQFFLPAGLFIDKEDRIFVADSINQRIQAFKYLREDQAGGKP
jgi:DNA-binding beta-propeller fold protein YncE